MTTPTSIIAQPRTCDTCGNTIDPATPHGLLGCIRALADNIDDARSVIERHGYDHMTSDEVNRAIEEALEEHRTASECDDAIDERVEKAIEGIDFEEAINAAIDYRALTDEVVDRLDFEAIAEKVVEEDCFIDAAKEAAGAYLEESDAEVQRLKGALSQAHDTIEAMQRQIDEIRWFVGLAPAKEYAAMDALVAEVAAAPDVPLPEGFTPPTETPTPDPFDPQI